MAAALPVAAATAADTMPPPRVPLAVAQPVASINSGAVVPSARPASLPESGLLVLVGGVLMGLGAMMRRAQRTS